jgi:L-serine dehydratase
MNPMEYIPSIFNDVIGPVMRGPSSSHCAAALRIGCFIRQLFKGEFGRMKLVFDRYGSLATTHEGQGSDMGLYSGLLGFDMTDDRIVNYRHEVEKARLEIEIEILDLSLDDPNTYIFKFGDSCPVSSLTAISTGGGMFEITEVDEFPVSILGDFHEVLIILPSEVVLDPDTIQKKFPQADYCMLTEGKQENLLLIKSHSEIETDLLEEVFKAYQPRLIRQITPVLPVGSQRSIELPFSTVNELIAYTSEKQIGLDRAAIHYEKARGGLSENEVEQKMMSILKILKQSIKESLKGTSYEDRILGYQSGDFKQKLENGQLIETGILNRIVLYITALMETKSSMGLIVAAPTAGSCGTLPGSVIAAAEQMEFDDRKICNALMAGGMIGIFIAMESTFAAEIGGCQAECGVASGMAAAALVTLFDGDTKTALSAASMALQNSMGMICDPVASRVEVPCLGKNVMAASNATACANMALAGFDQVIPLDEVIEAFDRVGRSLPRELRCTALGGLSITKTSREIEQKLKRKIKP